MVIKSPARRDPALARLARHGEGRLAGWKPKRRQRASDFVTFTGILMLTRLSPDERLKLFGMMPGFTVAEVEDAAAYLEELHNRLCVVAGVDPLESKEGSVR